VWDIRPSHPCRRASLRKKSSISTADASRVMVVLMYSVVPSGRERRDAWYLMFVVEFRHISSQRPAPGTSASDSTLPWKKDRSSSVTYQVESVQALHRSACCSERGEFSLYVGRTGS